MSLEVLKKLLMCHRGLGGTLIESGKVRLIFLQRYTNGMIYHLGNRSMHLFSFERECRRQIGIKLHGERLYVLAHDFCLLLRTTI